MLDKKFSLKSAFFAAALLAAGSANAYSLGGRGGGGEYSGAGGYSQIVLDYPDGSERHFRLVRLTDDSTADQQQEYYEAATNILRNYVRDIMPHMPQDKVEEFAWVLSRMAEDLNLITDAQTICSVIGYDYAFVERYELGKKIEDFRYYQESLSEPSFDSGYDLWPKALFEGEQAVGRYNQLLEDLGREFPNHRAYQRRPMTYDVLHDLRRDLGAQIADVLVTFSRDLQRGRIDPVMVDEQIQDFISMTTRVLAAPESVDDREQFSTGTYNVRMPEHIDNALAQSHDLSEVERNEIYRQLFTLRHSYDFRPIAREQDFMAGRDVIGAPKP